MPAEHTLRYLPAAHDDLIAILDYIAKESPQRALSFVGKLDKRIKLLEVNPSLGRKPRHQKLRESGYRVLIVDAYLIFYIVKETVVEIHRVIHGSRNLDHILWS